MDDFRTQLKEAIDAMTEAGLEPVFLVIDLRGSTCIKQGQGVESFEKFRQSALDALAAAAEGCDTFTHGEERIVGILPGFGRLKTFALIERLRRALMMLAQSYDCTLSPDFDAFEFDPASGVAGVVNHLATRPRETEDAREA